jgi:hypothetical protein
MPHSFTCRQGLLRVFEELGVYYQLLMQLPHHV